MIKNNYNFDKIVTLVPTGNGSHECHVQLTLINGKKFNVNFFTYWLCKNPLLEAENFAQELKNHLLDIFEHTTDLNFDRKIYNAKKAVSFFVKNSRRICR